MKSPEPQQSFSASYDAMPSLKSLNLSIAYYSILAADTLLYAVTLTFDPVILTFDLEHLQCIACDMMKLYLIWTQSSSLQWSYCDFSVWPNHNQAVCSGVIVISLYDLITIKQPAVELLWFHCMT